ncbi:MAG TPA: HD domain-containing phosphohydrolase, partial [Polyangiaceae bacterium]
PPENLRQAFAAAVEQHRLISAEKVLLEQTLRGSIKTLIDILSLTNPTAFGKATRIRDHAAAVAGELGITNLWQLEVAAMLSQLGTVVLPEATLERHFRGDGLSQQEQAMVGRISTLNQELLANIPRLEVVREWIAEIGATTPAASPPPKRWNEQCLELKILRIAHDFDSLEMEGLSTETSLDTMRGRAGWYEPAALDALARIRRAKTKGQVCEVSVAAVAPGKILVSDVRTTGGVLVLARGHQFTASSVERLRNYAKNTIREPIRITDK